MKVNSYYKLNVHLHVGYSTYTHAHEHTQVASGGRGGVLQSTFFLYLNMKKMNYNEVASPIPYKEIEI